MVKLMYELIISAVRYNHADNFVMLSKHEHKHKLVLHILPKLDLIYID